MMQSLIGSSLKFMYNFEKTFIILNSTILLKVFEQGWRKSNSSGGWGGGCTGLRVKLAGGAKMYEAPDELIWAIPTLHIFICGSHIYVYFVCC